MPGPVLACDIGSAQHASFALVGDAVNLASRIHELTKEVGADILVSGTTRARLGQELAVAGMPPVRMKGRSKEVEVYHAGLWPHLLRGGSKSFLSGPLGGLAPSASESRTFDTPSGAVLDGERRQRRFAETAV